MVFSVRIKQNLGAPRTGTGLFVSDSRLTVSQTSSVLREHCSL